MLRKFIHDFHTISGTRDTFQGHKEEQSIHLFTHSLILPFPIPVIQSPMVRAREMKKIGFSNKHFNK